MIDNVSFFNKFMIDNVNSVYLEEFLFGSI